MGEFGTRVKEIGADALNVMAELLNGGEVDTEKASVANKLIGHALKAEQMEQTALHQERSTAVKLIKYLTKEDRAAYVALMNPGAKRLEEGKQE